HLAPTTRSRANLIAEGVPEENIHVIGNTVIDALHWAVARPVGFTIPELQNVNDDNRRVLLVTTHRRENLGENMINIDRAMRELATRYQTYSLSGLPTKIPRYARRSNLRSRISIMSYPSNPSSMVSFHTSSPDPTSSSQT